MGRSGRGRRELKERKFEAFNVFSHERKIKSIDRVAGKVIVRIPKEGSVRDHQRRQSCLTCVRQNSIPRRSRFFHGAA